MPRSLVVVHVLIEGFLKTGRGGGFESLVSLTQGLDGVLARHATGWLKPAADEAVLVSMPPWSRERSAMDWADSLRSDVGNELGLDCSIGIAATRVAARVCSRMARPRGILLWMEGHEESLIGGLPLEELDELRPEQLQKLRASGIRSLDELAVLRPGDARALMGSEGEKLVGLVRGVDRVLESTRGGRLSRSVEILSRRLSRRLELCRRRARGLELQLGYADGVLWERYTLLLRPASDYEALHDAAERLLEMVHPRPEPVHGVSLTATGLTAAHGQLDLFGPGGRREVRVRLGRLGPPAGEAHAVASN